MNGRSIIKRAASPDYDERKVQFFIQTNSKSIQLENKQTLKDAGLRENDTINVVLRSEYNHDVHSRSIIEFEHGSHSESEEDRSMLIYVKT